MEIQNDEGLFLTRRKIIHSDLEHPSIHVNTYQRPAGAVDVDYVVLKEKLFIRFQ